jgi:hypothetical protein
MGMALEESTSGLEKLDSNGIEAFIESGLLGHIAQRGDIYIDYGTDRFGVTGFSIAIKRNPDEQGGCC